MNNSVLKYLIGLTSFLLAGIAAYFSITGLAKLFAGTGIAILVMASALEFSKLLVVSYLYRFWNYASRAIKIYLIIAVSILMMITSLGIYGFLTSGYQLTKGQFDIANTSIVYLQNQKASVTSKIESINNSIKTNDTRIAQLSTQRSNVEKRIDKSFESNRFSISNKQSNNANLIEKQIQILSDKNVLLENSKLSLMDTAANIELTITQNTLKNQTSTELGPLVYVSNLTGISLDLIVNILIGLFIFVFDPLAIVLLMVFNSLSIESEPEKELVATTIKDEPIKEEIKPDHIQEPFTELETHINKKEPIQETQPPNNTIKYKMYSDVR